MKKTYFSVLLFSLFSISVFAQGLYFDIGLGIGLPVTEIDGTNVSSSMGSSVTEVGVELGCKLGYGPIAGIPLYVVCELSGIGHRFEDSYNYLQFNSYLIGPGVIFYPIPLIQLGVSAGYSFVANDTDLPVYMYESEYGYGGNVSVAFDLGNDYHACLLGLKYSIAINTLETSGAEQFSSIFCAFVRYAFRHRF
jgi:hypothetical protein